MDLLLLTHEKSAVDLLPALDLLPHSVSFASPSGGSAMVAALRADHQGRDAPEVILVDARTDLVGARTLCRTLGMAAIAPVVPVLRDGGLIAVTAEWNVDDFLLIGAAPAEVDARLRLAAARSSRRTPDSEENTDAVLALGDLVVEEDTYTARLRGKPLDLTYREFELLRFLMSSPGRVFSRDQLLREVWGYDFFGSSRTVDVHVRRLRSKLGAEYEAIIGTVRNVGYKAVRPVASSSKQAATATAKPTTLAGVAV